MSCVVVASEESLRVFSGNAGFILSGGDGEATTTGSGEASITMAGQAASLGMDRPLPLARKTHQDLGA